MSALIARNEKVQGTLCNGIINNFDTEFAMVKWFRKQEQYFDKMIKIEDFRKGEEQDISLLVARVFDEYVSPDYLPEGNRFFHDFIKPEKFVERHELGTIILTAKDNDLIIGMIEVRTLNHISLLFVDKNYQRRMIAKNLFQEALRRCRAVEPGLSMFFVHASPFSVPVYQKLGFTALSGMKEANGIFYLPMQKTLAAWPAGI